MKPSKFLTARSTVIVLFIAISVVLLFASSVPQRASLGGKIPEWVGKLPVSLQFISTLLGLDNIVGSSWFAILVMLFWVSLVISTVSQFRATRMLVDRLPSAALPQECTRIGVSSDAFLGLAKAAGYRLAGSSDGVYLYVKNRIGYWGNFLLHIGLVISVFFSLVYVLTQHRVLVRLAGQEITRLTTDTVQEMQGIMSHRQRLPYSIVLKTLEPRFWGNDKQEYLASELYITDQLGAEPQRVSVALSDKSQYGPYIVYQSNDYGRTFDLEFVAGGETRRERLCIPYPPRRDKAGYGELAIPGTDLLLKGKFYADVERKTMKLHEPPLTLRLFRGKELLGEVTLAPGGVGQLGPFAVRLVGSEWWTDILLDGTYGTAGIFTGFALILAGVLCSFCLVPREIVVREAEGKLYVQHVVRRFAQFYREEFDDIIQNAAGTGEV